MMMYDDGDGDGDGDDVYDDDDISVLLSHLGNDTM